MRYKILFILLMATLLSLTLSFLLQYQAVNAAPKQASDITCQISSQTVTYGQAVNVSGRLVDASTGAGLKRMINLTCSEDNGTSWIQLKKTPMGGLEEEWERWEEWGDPIWTTEDGYYGPYTWKPENIPNKILVKAFWNGDTIYEASESTIQTLEVELPSSPPVVVLSHRSYIDGSLWITGEVQNVGSTNLKSVQMTTTYYNENGTIIGADYDDVDIYMLVPGQKSPFITFAGITKYPNIEINVSDIASYTVVVRAYEPTIEEPYTNMQIINLQSGLYGYFYNVSGTIKNNGTISVGGVKAVTTFYFANGSIADAWYDYTSPDALNPNDTSEFDIELFIERFETVGPIDYFVLQVDCYIAEIYVPQWSIRLGESGTVYGYIPSIGEQVNVTLTYGKPDGAFIARQVTAGGETTAFRRYDDTFIPDQAGVWNVSASWPGDMGNSGVSSKESFTVLKALSLISCFAPNSVELGESITVTGSLSPAREGINVTLTFTKPDNSTFITPVMTTSGGLFSYTFQPEHNGTWNAEATWAGDTNYEGAGTSRSFIVEEFVVPIVPVVPIREIPLPETAVVAVATGAAISVGVTGLMSLSGLGQSLNSAIEKMNIPGWLKDFLQSYFEEVFETVTEEKLEAKKKTPLFTKKEIASIIFSASIITIVFAYVEANGLPEFLSTAVFAAVIPSVLSSVVVISVAGAFFTALSSKICGVRTEFKVWLYGVIAFLISGLLFLVPFAGPSRSVYQCGEISKKTKGLLILSKMLLFLTLSIPFSLLFLLGFKTLGDTGLLISLTTICYSLIPIKPLEGKEIFDFDKKVWLATFAPVLLLFLGWILHLLPHIVYLGVGLLSTFFWAFTFYQAKKQKAK